MVFTITDGGGGVPDMNEFSQFMASVNVSSRLPVRFHLSVRDLNIKQLLDSLDQNSRFCLQAFVPQGLSSKDRLFPGLLVEVPKPDVY